MLQNSIKTAVIIFTVTVDKRHKYVENVNMLSNTLTVTVSLLEIAVKDRIAGQSDKQYKLQNKTMRLKNIAENHAQI